MMLAWPAAVSSQITCFQTIFCRKESFKQVLKKFSFFSLLGTLKKSHPIIKLCYKISLLISFMNSFFPFFYSILVFIFLISRAYQKSHGSVCTVSVHTISGSLPFSLLLFFLLRACASPKIQSIGN